MDANRSAYCDDFEQNEETEFDRRYEKLSTHSDDPVVRANQVTFQNFNAVTDVSITPRPVYSSSYMASGSMYTDFVESRRERDFNMTSLQGPISSRHVSKVNSVLRPASIFFPSKSSTL